MPDQPTTRPPGIPDDVPPELARAAYFGKKPRTDLEFGPVVKFPPMREWPIRVTVGPLGVCEVGKISVSTYDEARAEIAATLRAVADEIHPGTADEHGTVDLGDGFTASWDETTRDAAMNDQPPPDARCDLSDLPVSQCACRLHNPVLSGPKPAEDLTGHHVFPAQYHGLCTDCGEPIHPGDRITIGPGGYIHEECS